MRSMELGPLSPVLLEVGLGHVARAAPQLPPALSVPLELASHPAPALHPVRATDTSFLTLSWEGAPPHSLACTPPFPASSIKPARVSFHECTCCGSHPAERLPGCSGRGGGDAPSEPSCFCSAFSPD